MIEDVLSDATRRMDKSVENGQARVHHDPHRPGLGRACSTASR